LRRSPSICVVGVPVDADIVLSRAKKTAGRVSAANPFELALTKHEQPPPALAPLDERRPALFVPDAKTAERFLYT
jgi:hypothetical protein